MRKELQLIDVIIRTKNSQEFLKRCMDSVLAEIPVRRIIIIDAGSTDETKEIASTYDNADIYVKPDLNLGQATKYGLSKSQTDWVAIIDSDVILQKGWFDDMKKYMDEADAVEGCRVDHYFFDVRIDTTKSNWGRFGQTLLKKELVMNIDLDTPFGEDAMIKLKFDSEGRTWKKVPNYLADHHTKIDSTKHSRTGLVYRPEPHIISVPKQVQIRQGHLARKCHVVTNTQAVKRLLVPPIYEAYWAFKKNIWFTLAYFRLL